MPLDEGWALRGPEDGLAFLVTIKLDGWTEAPRDLQLFLTLLSSETTVMLDALAPLFRTYLTISSSPPWREAEKMHLMPDILCSSGMAVL
jgi:hypothetical protein